MANDSVLSKLSELQPNNATSAILDWKNRGGLGKEENGLAAKHLRDGLKFE